MSRPHFDIALNYICLSTRLNFWDLGGQEELQALWDKYFAECHAIIYTVDSNDRERIEESKKSFDVMIKNENLKGVPLLLLANKQDLPGKIVNFQDISLQAHSFFCIQL